MNTTKQTAKSAGQHGGKAKPMQTRSVAYRGMTLAELGACSDLPVGASVHVKVQYDKDVPYHRGDDFHHWVTYLGDGKFTDSRNVSATGARLDTFLQGWVRSKLHKRMYRHLHRAPYAKRARRKAKWRPVAGLQPRVTEVFMMAQRQSEEKKARRHD